MQSIGSRGTAKNDGSSAGNVLFSSNKRLDERVNDDGGKLPSSTARVRSKLQQTNI